MVGLSKYFENIPTKDARFYMVFVSLHVKGSKTKCEKLSLKINFCSTLPTPLDIKSNSIITVHEVFFRHLNPNLSLGIIMNYIKGTIK